MCDEAVLGLLESDNNTPEIRYAAFKSVGAAVSRAEQQYRGGKLQGARVLTLMHAQGKSGGRLLMSCLVSFQS